MSDESMTTSTDTETQEPAREIQKPRIRTSEVLDLLEKGYTRTNDQKDYNPEIGSICDYYGLNEGQVRLLFKHPALKNKRTKVVPVPEFILEDDTSEESVTQDPNISEEVVEDTNTSVE